MFDLLDLIFLGGAAAQKEEADRLREVVKAQAQLIKKLQAKIDELTGESLEEDWGGENPNDPYDESYLYGSGHD